MNRTIKMIGLDLDGTLLNSKKELTEYTRSVLEKAIGQGIVVLVSTGRPYSGIPKELREFPGMRYAVTANGARVLDVQEDKVLFEGLLSIETAKKAIDILKKYDTIHEIFVEGVGYTNEEGLKNAYQFFEQAHMVNYLLTTRNPVKDVNETLDGMKKSADKVHGIFKSTAERKKAREELEQLEGVTVTGAMGNNLEVNKQGVDKGAALLKLGKLLGIKREEIMACGDGMNDYKMLETVGFAVAMENGHEKIKEIADYVTVSNDDDGVAKAIERFALK